jgi:predicted DNA-binding transcriptional regulator YafY
VLSEHVGVLPEDRVRIDPEVWAQVAGHIERREAMRADYQSFAGRVSRYGLHPLHLLAYHGNWYVLARNAEKSQIETFALSRFRGIEAAGSTFTRPADFDAQRYARQAFGITSGEKPIKVRLLFETETGGLCRRAGMAPEPEAQAPSRWPGRDAAGDNRAEGTVRWLLSWIPDVKVLAPKSLRDRIVEKLQDGLQRQDEASGPNQTLHTNREQARGR